MEVTLPSCLFPSPVIESSNNSSAQQCRVYSSLIQPMDVSPTDANRLDACPRISRRPSLLNTNLSTTPYPQTPPNEPQLLTPPMKWVSESPMDGFGSHSGLPPSPISPQGGGATSHPMTDAPWNLVPYMTMAGPMGNSFFYRSPTPSSRHRTSQACEKCRERKTKCSGSRPTCRRCEARGLICEYAPEGGKQRGTGGATASNHVSPKNRRPSVATLNTDVYSSVPDSPISASDLASSPQLGWSLSSSSTSSAVSDSASEASASPYHPSSYGQFSFAPPPPGSVVFDFPPPPNSSVSLHRRIQHGRSSSHGQSPLRSEVDVNHHSLRNATSMPDIRTPDDPALMGIPCINDDSVLHLSSSPTTNTTPTTIHHHGLSQQHLDNQTHYAISDASMMPLSYAPDLSGLVLDQQQHPSVPPSQHQHHHHHHHQHTDQQQHPNDDDVVLWLHDLDDFMSQQRSIESFGLGEERLLA